MQLRKRPERRRRAGQLKVLARTAGNSAGARSSGQGSRHARVKWRQGAPRQFRTFAEGGRFARSLAAALHARRNPLRQASSSKDRSRTRCRRNCSRRPARQGGRGCAARMRERLSIAFSFLDSAGRSPVSSRRVAQRLDPMPRLTTGRRSDLRHAMQRFLSHRPA